ncbi:DsbA family oxidoreductase [Actinophytocola xanthii]|uniref:DsbA family oxidoreductase n=1 Tax=Actinophytocola xanthii TaxID=1912961 RepID=UPI0009FB2061|nr:DsbA family protein [Actinophytocola xanthii]
MGAPEVRDGTIVVYSDIACPWATVAIARLLRARTEFALDEDVHLDHRSFLLEDVNSAPVAKRVVDAELPVVQALEPELGWTSWQGDPSTWPVTAAPANEAVHAAKRQSLRAAEELDLALRLALFRDSRCIALRHEILDVASSCPSVDVEALGAALDDGSARATMMRDYREHRDAVRGSPHLFFADGYEVHNPGVELRWPDGPGTGSPVVERDDPEVYGDLVRRAVMGSKA